MGVSIDPTGGDQQPVGIDSLFCLTAEFAHLDDATILDGDIAGIGALTGSIDDGPAFDQGIVHHKT